MQRSNAFFAVILGLAAIRLAARGYLDAVLTAQQTGAVFYLAGIRHKPDIDLQTMPYPRRSANTAFNPPNANEFDSAHSTCTSRA